MQASILQFDLHGNHFWPRPLYTVGKFERKCEICIQVEYRHVGTLHWGILMPEIECKHSFYDSTFMEAIFGHAHFGPWENLTENVKSVYMANIGMLVHYTGVF